MDEYLAKPYNKDALLLMVNKVLNPDYLLVKSMYKGYTEDQYKAEILDLLTGLNDCFTSVKYNGTNKYVVRIRQICKAFGLNAFGSKVFKFQLQIRKGDYKKAEPIMLELNVAVKEIMKKEWS